VNSSTTPSEIVSLLRRQIEGFGALSQTDDVGEVLMSGDGIARVYGLSAVVSGELVEIDVDNGHCVSGIALNLEEDNVGVVLLDDAVHVKEGQRVRRSGAVAQVPVGEELLGRVVDPLGRPLDGGPALTTTRFRPIETKAPGIVERENVNQPLFTGLKAIDALVPIGRGQRELIIGDRRTGKTAIAIDAIINQRNNAPGQQVHCFYVAIGQKQSSVVRTVEKLREYGALDYTTIICAPAGAPAPLQYIAPYAGCAMAEYFRDSGRHALIIYDDLTKQAQAYRQLSLLLRRPPGREAFPGDVFYIHSRLLERAARLSTELGGGSLTALPIVETQAGDISAYIPTNVVSITDGQIFLEAHLFNSGLRPAINAGLSVSRVGGAAQNKAMKQIAGSLRLDLAQYRELASFSQFSADLDKTTKAQLARGERLTEILKQKQYQPQEVMLQVLMIFAATRGYLDNYATNKVQAFERHLHQFLEVKYRDFMARLRSAGAMSDALQQEARTILDDFATVFDPELSEEDLDGGLNLGLALAISQGSGPSQRELMKMIERATAKELITPEFDSEVKNILDGPAEPDALADPFDTLVQESTILDIEAPLSIELLFEKAATTLAAQVHTDSTIILDRLTKREQTDSTALTPDFAVPHMILDGEGEFGFLAVRSQAGVRFSISAPAVHAIFFLVGTIDKRNTHLQSLAAVAQSVNAPGFVANWTQAADTDALRTLLCTARRSPKS
jgi:F-type H+-transporting ATPase subunit alpha